MTRPISLPWLAVKGVWCIHLICISIANDTSNTREGLRSLSSNETGLQELAQASVSDGLQSQDIMELSGLGAFRSYANNYHRDLLRLLENKLKNSRHCPTLSIQVPALDSKEENPKTMATWDIFHLGPQLLTWHQSCALKVNDMV